MDRDGHVKQKAAAPFGESWNKIIQSFQLFFPERNTLRYSLPLLCPSFRCQDGAILLGIVQEEARVAFAANPIVIDQHFVDLARKGRTPEARFRFAGPCAQGACSHWRDGRCRVIDRVLTRLKSHMPGDELVQCSIRNQCRWYAQSGPCACSVCPEVITNHPLPDEHDSPFLPHDRDRD